MSMAATATLQISPPLRNPISFRHIRIATLNCKQKQEVAVCCVVSKRSFLSLCLTSTLLFSTGFRDCANAAILEADDDLELLEKLSSGPEEKTEVETFNSSVAKLIASVSHNDIQTSKQAFVSSATALEKWVSLAGLASQIKGI